MFLKTIVLRINDASCGKIATRIAMLGHSRHRVSSNENAVDSTMADYCTTSSGERHPSPAVVLQLAFSTQT